jgi:hypothetical protein
MDRGERPPDASAQRNLARTTTAGHGCGLSFREVPTQTAAREHLTDSNDRNNNNSNNSRQDGQDGQDKSKTSKALPLSCASCPSCLLLLLLLLSLLLLLAGGETEPRAGDGVGSDERDRV